jgi:hypothetical protein
MKIEFEGIKYNIPKYSQYADYEYALMCNCKCGYGTHEDSIVGIAEYPDGRLLLLRECPKCGEKWWCHISTTTDFQRNTNCDIETLYEYADLGLLDKFKINNDD